VAADVTLGHYVAKCDVQLHVTTKVRAMIGFLVEVLQVRAWAE
jgi:hypothetical protein